MIWVEIILHKSHFFVWKMKNIFIKLFCSILWHAKDNLVFKAKVY